MDTTVVRGTAHVSSLAATALVKRIEGMFQDLLVAFAKGPKAIEEINLLSSQLEKLEAEHNAMCGRPYMEHWRS